MEARLKKGHIFGHHTNRGGGGSKPNSKVLIYVLAGKEAMKKEKKTLTLLVSKK